MAILRKQARRKSAQSKLTFVPLEPRQMMAADFQITEFLASNSSGIVNDNGGTSDWIEIFNAGTSTGNLNGYTLTDDASELDKFTLPSVNVGAGQFLVVFADDDAAPNSGNDIYTGFGLSAGGEYVALFDPAGNLLSEFGDNGTDYPIQSQDVSYGVQFSGSNISSPEQVGFFNTPTPGAANGSLTAGFTAPVFASTPAGFYNSTFEVLLSTATDNATIRYTTDGSTPSSTNGLIYNGAISVSETTNLRAVATRPNFNSSPSETWTYIFVNDVLDQSNDGTAPTNFPAVGSINHALDYGIDPDVRSIEGDQAIINALLAIPTVSITTDIDNLFDEDTGIYTNSRGSGIEFEREASVELINPDGSEGFQINAGLRIRGGFSRLINNPKHSFRLLFRSEYGDSRLEYPIHGDSGVDSFDKLDFRTPQNYSWSKDGDETNAFILEEFNRQNQLALGQTSTRSTWVQIYLNGQYWGLYQTQERVDNNFAADYLGGDADDYDVIKVNAGPDAPNFNEATDGTIDAYDRLRQQTVARAADGVTPAFVDNDAYYRVQGLNPDGTPNANFENLLDVDNLIDYITLIQHSGNFDAPISRFGRPNNTNINNYQAARNRNGDHGFQFFVHDSEHSFRDVDQDRTEFYLGNTSETSNTRFDLINRFNPQYLHQELMANVEYRNAFADRVQEIYFNDGPLSTDNLLARFDALVAEIDEAVVAESARWGDAHTDDPLLRSDWVTAVSDVRNNIVSQRTGVYIGQLQDTIIKLRNSPTSTNYTDFDAPLFSNVNAPDFSIEGDLQHGGNISAGDELGFNTTSQGTVYFTTDGTDPREVGGSVNSDAQVFNGSSSTTTSTLFPAGSNWRYEDNGINLGTTWRDPGFDDSNWDNGDGRLGFGDNNVNETTINLGPAGDRNITTYFRREFTSTGDYDTATLSISRDDGVVVYVNGVEVVRDNLPAGQITYLTTANSAIGNAAETRFNDFTIPASLLVAGTNTIAVEVHQVNANSSDVGFDAELTVTRSTVAEEGGIPLDVTTPILSRVLAADGTWSALQSAVFTVADGIASADNIRVTEINYNPLAGGAEFIEIQNIGGVTVDLSGVTLTEGPSVPLTLATGTTLDAGEFGLFVNDVAAFTAAYPNVDPALILGTFAGGLSNGGEGIALLAADGSEIADFSYADSDPFPIAADGAGASLELISPDVTPADEVGKYYAWQSSLATGGTPGAAAVIAPQIVINEVLANSDGFNVDFIELRNNGSSAVNIGGWYLSDSADLLNSFQIPAGTVISAGGYAVFDEIDFNVGPNAFALSSSGEEVWLTAGTGANTQFIDALEFSATASSVTIGLNADGTGRHLPLAAPTPGAENTASTVSPIVISEINYHPDPPSSAALAIEPGLTEGDLEFIELTNTLSTTQDLSQWRLRGESDFDFTTETIAGGESIVLVNFDPNDPVNANRADAFRAHYGISNTVTLIGGTSGALSNSFGRVALQRFQGLDTDGTTLFSLADEVLYDDLAPWADADGTGLTLTRTAANTNGSLSDSWIAAVATPGSDNLGSYAPEVLASIRDNSQIARPDLIDTISFVFDADVIVRQSHLQLQNLTLGQSVNVNDASVQFTYDPSTLTATWDVSALDLNEAYFQATLSQAVTARSSGIRLDGNSNQNTGGNHVQQLYVAIPGDANLDGDVDVNDSDIFAQENTGDLAIALRNIGRTGRIDWSTGDFNADGDVDQVQADIFSGQQFGDISVLLANVGKNAGNFPVPVVAAVTTQAVTTQATIAAPTTQTVIADAATEEVVADEATPAVVAEATAVESVEVAESVVLAPIAPVTTAAAPINLVTPAPVLSVPASVELVEPVALGLGD